VSEHRSTNNKQSLDPVFYSVSPIYYTLFPNNYVFDYYSSSISYCLAFRKDQEAENVSPTKVTKEEALKEISLLKKEISGNDNFNTDEIRKTNKAYDPRWLVGQLRISRLLSMEDMIKNTKTRLDDNVDDDSNNETTENTRKKKAAEDTKTKTPTQTQTQPKTQKEKKVEYETGIRNCIKYIYEQSTKTGTENKTKFDGDFKNWSEERTLTADEKVAKKAEKDAAKATAIENNKTIVKKPLSDADKTKFCASPKANVFGAFYKVLGELTITKIEDTKFKCGKETNAKTYKAVVDEYCTNLKLKKAETDVADCFNAYDPFNIKTTMGCTWAKRTTNEFLNADDEQPEVNAEETDKNED